MRVLIILLSFFILSPCLAKQLKKAATHNNSSEKITKGKSNRPSLTQKTKSNIECITKELVSPVTNINKSSYTSTLVGKRISRSKEKELIDYDPRFLPYMYPLEFCPATEEVPTYMYGISADFGEFNDTNLIDKPVK